GAAHVVEGQDVLVARMVGTEQRREDGGHDEGADEEEPDESGRVPPQPRPGVDPEPACRRLERELLRFELDDAHDSLMRGLMIAYEMSTIRLTKTKTIATKRIPPWRTG